MSEWKKIDDIKDIDDGLCLAFGKCGIELVCWNPEAECWDGSDGDDYYKDPKGYFTHWMPLPEPPKDIPHGN